jgi:hypothetical protein
MRFCSMTCGLHDLPHVRDAGSAGSAWKSRKTIMLRATSIRIIATTRRMM